MKRLLHALCCPHGQILDIIVKRVPDRLRGTAFVAFTTDTAAQSALAALNGAVVLGRQIRVEWARGESRAFKEFVMYALGAGQSQVQLDYSQREVVDRQASRQVEEDDMDVE